VQARPLSDSNHDSTNQFLATWDQPVARAIRGTRRRVVRGDISHMGCDRSLGSSILPRRFHRMLQFDRESVVQFISREVPPLLRPDSLILDAGSGSEEEQYFREMLRTSGARAHACDIAPRKGLDLQADLERMPIGDSSYDLIICTQVLEHVRHPGVVCKELFRMLKDGGHLLITVPQGQEMHDLPNHYFNYTYYGIRLVLEEAGFKIVGIEPQGGHFRKLGIELHTTCKVVRANMTTLQSRILLAPVLLACQILFGFVAKTVCLGLDSFDRRHLSTLGWNVHCCKPELS
jgi:SAM-dependent methyltransferase